MSSVLPYLPAALEALMSQSADVTDMADVMQLLVQLMMRFKEGLEKLVEAALPVAVAKTHALLGKSRHQGLGRETAELVLHEAHAPHKHEWHRSPQGARGQVNMPAIL